MEISTDYPLLWKSIRNFHIFSWVEIFLRIFWQPFLLGIFPQNFLLCGNLFHIFQEKIIKIFHNFSRVDLFHKIVVANHAMLRKFRTPQNLSEEGFQLFSCLAWPSEVKNKYWYCYHQSVQTPLDCLIFVSLSWIPNFSILGYV